ncbi:NUDIX hydrolase [Streptomyces sp. NPDC005141]
MTETAPSTGVEFLDVRRLLLAEVEAPHLTPQEEQARDAVWSKALAANPSLFDGPVAACAGAAWKGPGELLLSWARVTYRHYALRRVPGNTSWLPSLFVNVVQPTEDGRMLVVQMSPSTAAPGRWQLPGGSVEPPGERGVLDEVGVRGDAARELAEEIGAPLAPQDLQLWAVTRGENRSIGLVFLAVPQPGKELYRRFASVTATERARGHEPELNQIALVGAPTELGDLDGPHADYLEPVVRRFAELRGGATPG